MAIPKITLPESSAKDLKRTIREHIAAAEELHSSWEQLHDLYLRQYLCEPDVATKSWPWNNASNLFLPLARVIHDGVLSQLHDAMFTNFPYVKVDPVEPSDYYSAEIFSTFYGEYVYRKVIDLMKLGNDWNFGLGLDGTGIVRPRWERKQELRRERRIEQMVKYETVKDEILGQPTEVKIPTGIDEKVGEDVSIQTINRPVVDLVDLHRFFVAPDTINSLEWPDCEWYYVHEDLTWSQLLERKRIGFDGIDETLQSMLGQRDMTFSERTARRTDALSESTTLTTTPMLEFYLRWPLPIDSLSYTDQDGKNRKLSQTGTDEDDDSFAEEVIVNYLPATDTISRVVPLQRIYPTGRRPHIMNWYSYIPGRIYGLGIQAKMRSLNSMMNAGSNQMIDYGTLQNMPWYIYDPGLGNLPDMMSIEPGQGIPIPGGGRSVTIPRMNGDYGFWLNINQLVQAWAERDGNITDFSLGRSPERSSTKTARGTIALLQQGQVAFGRLATLIVQAYNRMFDEVHALYGQHAPDDILFRVTGQRGQFTMPRGALREQVDFEFVLNPNRQAEIQNIMQIFQLFMAIPYVAQNPMGVRAMAELLWDKVPQHNSMDFNQIWPVQQPPTLTGQLGGGVQPGQSASPPQVGAPPLPQPGASGPSLSSALAPLTSSMPTSDIGVKIQ